MQKLKWLRQVEAVAITNVLCKTLGMEITIRIAVIGGAATTMALIDVFHTNLGMEVAQGTVAGGAVAWVATTGTVYCRADHKYALTIRNNKVTLAPSNPFDPRQHWYKEHKLGTQVKDAIGLPSFALVNKATMEAIQHGGAGAQPVQLVKYEANDVKPLGLWRWREICREGGRDEGVETAATAMETVVFSVCGDGVRFGFASRSGSGFVQVSGPLVDLEELSRTKLWCRQGMGSKISRRSNLETRRSNSPGETQMVELRQVEAVAITNVLSKTLGMEITIRIAVIGGAATTMALIATARIRHVTATIAVKRKYL
nr:ricin B-like lectin EULS3 [Ipomoea batatas]